MSARLPGLAIAAALLAACTPANATPTPTLIVMGIALPTTTPFATATGAATPTPIVIYTTTPTIEPPPTHTPSATPTVTATPRHIGTETSDLVTCSGTFAPDNLLVNGGFEGGQHPSEIDSIQVPDGWTAFYRPIGTEILYDINNKDGYQRPEMKVISRDPPYTNPPRVADGSHAFTITGDQRAFDAGIYQTVTVTPGDVLCLTGGAQAWSNRFSDDPFSSTLDTLDDERNANFQLGVDLQGGTDPFSLNVQWGEVTHQYNLYKPMNAVQVTAAGPSITVFVRGFMLWRFDHNELFFDDILLARKGLPSTPTPGAVTPTP